MICIRDARVLNGTQYGSDETVQLLLQAGADAGARTASNKTARDLALEGDEYDKIRAVCIDVHLAQQLRAHFVDFCIACRGADWPVLVLLECFAWSSAMTYAGEVSAIALDVRWRIAKRIREEREQPQRN